MINPKTLTKLRLVRSIKNFAEPRFLATLFLSITSMVGRMVIVSARETTWRIVARRSWRRSRRTAGPLNQFVEFTPVKPNSPALGAIVNFNALAFGHQEV
jgi:hypothetical protein